MKNLFFLLFICVIYQTPINAQKTWAVWQQEFTSNTDEWVTAKQPFNALTLISTSTNPISGLLITEKKDTFSVYQDPHINEQNQSQLLFFNKPIRRFKFLSDESEIKISCYFQSDTLHIDIPKSRFEEDSCSLPYIVPQSVWRQGLPDPVPGRTRTLTQHCIIHHSASSNADTNTIALVRAFYLQHTQVNHWDDIGYNYLIGHDGTLVAGRDPLGSGIAQDEVLGAHFCGKNSNTMGICVIGNFQEEPPTIEAIHTLERLLIWKTHKDVLSPLDSITHQGILLPVIAGHRNGCSTECPGDSLFSLIPQIRQDVANRILSCPQLDINDLSENSVIVWPNPASEWVFISGISGISSAHLVNLSGKTFTCKVTEDKISFPKDVPGGSYTLIIYSKKNVPPKTVLIQIFH